MEFVIHTNALVLRGQGKIEGNFEKLSKNNILILNRPNLKKEILYNLKYNRITNKDAAVLLNFYDTIVKNKQIVLCSFHFYIFYLSGIIDYFEYSNGLLRITPEILILLKFINILNSSDFYLNLKLVTIFIPIQTPFSRFLVLNILKMNEI